MSRLSRSKPPLMVLPSHRLQAVTHSIFLGNLMTNPAPVVTLSGIVRSCSERQVAAVEAAPAQVDPETGRRTRDPREARDAYLALDLVILTDDGGFAQTVVTFDEDGSKALAGVIPKRGDEVEWLVRPYFSWEGRPGRKYPALRFSLARELMAAAVSSSPRLASTGS